MNIFKDSQKMRKICNSIVAFLFVFTIFTFSVMYSTRDRIDTSASTTYDDAVSDANRYNQLITKPKVDEIEESKYTTGIEAFMTAWENHFNATSYTITGSNTSTATPPMVGEYIILASIRAAKWEDGLVFQELHKYQKQGSKTFVDMNEGSQTYSTITERFTRKTKDGISINGDGYVSAYYGSGYVKDDKYSEVTPICYVVNESTINACTYFSVNRIAGKIRNYEVQLKLNPNASVKGYDEAIMNSGELDCLPTFSSVTITATIDKDGYFTSVNVLEEYVIKKSLTIPTKNNITYNISGYNQTPTIDRPC